MARKRLENRPRLGADAEGVALSAFDSFFRGAEADYDDLCRIYRDRLRNSANSIDVNLMAWAWCIGPHEASELEWIIQKTEASLSMPLPPIEKITMLNTLGALFYRAGGFFAHAS